MNIQGATGVLYNITGGSDLTLHETSEAAEIIRAAAMRTPRSSTAPRSMIRSATG